MGRVSMEPEFALRKLLINSTGRYCIYRVASRLKTLAEIRRFGEEVAQYTGPREGWKVYVHIPGPVTGHYRRLMKADAGVAAMYDQMPAYTAGGA